MKRFQRFFGKPHRRPGEPHFPTNYDGSGCWWAEDGVLPLAAGRGFNLPVVGELQWQDSIAAVVGGRCEEGHNCQMPAQLVFDDANPHDPNAIGVMIDSHAVGWIPWEKAVEFRAALRKLNIENLPVTCKAKVIGGWDRGRKDRGLFGVKLSLSMPLKVRRDALRRN